MRRVGLPPGRQAHDPRLLAAIQLLIAQGADKTAHAHERSLLTHLVGTARLLLAWNAPINTVRAGLCHSIYGTNVFRKVSLGTQERTRLQQTIGRRAEALVWLFSQLRRPATLLRALRNDTGLVRERSGRTRHIDAYTLQQLFILECANLLDQGISMSRTRKLLREAVRLPNVHPEMLRSLREQHRDDLRFRAARWAIVEHAI